MVLKSVALRLLYQCYFFCLGLTTLILAGVTVRSLTDSLDDYQYLLNNWFSDVITDISVAQEGQSCQSIGTDYFSLFTYEWPGSKAGCDCRNITRGIINATVSNKSKNIQNIIYTTGKCNKDQIAAKCQTIQELDKMYFYQWNDGYQNAKFRLCGKRLKGYNFASHTPRGSNCSAGLKKCGSNYDGQFYCVPQNSSCPIVFLTFATSAQYQNPKWIPSGLPTQYESLPITNNFALVYSRNFSDLLPIVELRFAEGDGVCMKNDLNNISPNRTDYPLLLERRQPCRIDPRFIPVHSINEQQFFSANYMDKIDQTLPLYRVNPKFKWSMYTRSIVQWQEKCRGDKLQQLLRQEGRLNQIYDTQSGLLVVNVFFFLIISLILTITQFTLILKDTEKALQDKFLKIEIVIKVILQLTQTIIIIYSFQNVFNQMNYFQNLIDLGCTDGFQQGTFINLKNVIKDRVFNYNLGQLVLLCITLLIDTVVLGKFVLRKKQEQQHTTSPAKFEMVTQKGTRRNPSSDDASTNQLKVFDA